MVTQHSGFFQGAVQAFDLPIGAGMRQLSQAVLDGDKRELDRWVDWLPDSSAITTVSRDFTSTTHWSAIAPKVNELVYFLQKTGRSFHVIVVGSGRANAPRILKQWIKAGHTVSVVTSAPIMKALSGVKYELDANGISSEARCNHIVFPFPRLIEHNLAVFEETLFRAIAGTSAACVASRNIASAASLTIS